MSRLAARLRKIAVVDKQSTFSMQWPLSRDSQPLLSREKLTVIPLADEDTAAGKIIDAHAPERIITFGGDCLISQAPFAYLNEKYEGKLGIIWIDAHPDVTTPEDFDHAHAMVLGNLLGGGEPLMAGEVKRHVRPEQVVLVGVDGVLPHEQNAIERFGLKVYQVRR